MANWCNNLVIFEGTPEKLKSVNTLFQQMKEKEQREQCGQLPDFVEGDIYFFDIENCEDTEEEGVFRYMTKWIPNIEEIRQIADHFNLDFTLEYSELSCLVFGKTFYINKELTDYCLDDYDVDKFVYDEEKGTYHFVDDKEEFESEIDILEILLEDKINYIEY